MIKLSVIILCYNGDQWIGPCVSSLEEQTLDRGLYEIILADNGGNTTSLRRYQSAFQTTVIRFSNNYGFTGGNNRALLSAHGDIVLLMNQDILVHYRCLEEILHAFDRFPDAGAISTNMQMIHSSREGKTQEQCPESVGFFRTTKFGFAQYTLVKTNRSVFPVSFVSGNGLGFRKSVLADTDGYLFDERLGSYAEDLDFSLRLTRSGRIMLVAAKAVIFHFRDAAFSGSLRQIITKFVHISSNRLMVHWKNGGPVGFFIRLPLLLLGVVLKIGRLDGAAGFDWLKFFAGTATIPLVLFQVGIRLVRNANSPIQQKSRDWLADEVKNKNG